MAGKVTPVDLRLMAAISGELEGLNVAALCRERGMSRKTFYKWRGRFALEGIAGLEERSRRPQLTPTRYGDHVEDAVVECRKALQDEGWDPGPASIAWRLRGRVSPVPSEATIWRMLVRRGCVVPQPQKRPKTSWRSFVAAAPNECWQIDATEWQLGNGQRVEIINVVDDHSRLAVANRSFPTATGEAAWETFAAGAQQWGLPSRCLSDNGLCFSGRLRGAQVLFETNLLAAGIRPVTSRPYHPQTCGKVERFQQTEKRWLGSRRRPDDIAELDRLLDEFADYYNRARPHRSLGRRTPQEVWNAADRAGPAPGPLTGRLPLSTRQRPVTSKGHISLGRYLIGIGQDRAGQLATVQTNGDQITVTIDDEVIRRFTIDPTRTYQPSGRRRGPRRKDGS
jgi:transposase InsO family protein